MLANPDLEILGPIWHEAPAQHVEAAFSGLGVVPDDRERIGGRHVPTGRKVGGRPMRRDREDELDLANVGREANPAAHRAEDRIARCQAQAGTLALRSLLGTYREHLSDPVRSEAAVFFTFPEDAYWNTEQQAAEFGVEIGEYRGVVRVPRHVFQRLLPERPTPERCVEAYYLQRPRFESIAERKLRRRQLTEDGNVEISGRDLG